MGKRRERESGPRATRLALRRAIQRNRQHEVEDHLAVLADHNAGRELILEEILEDRDTEPAADSEGGDPESGLPPLRL